jgi:hypothetical protein
MLHDIFAPLGKFVVKQKNSSGSVKFITIWRAFFLFKYPLKFYAYRGQRQVDGFGV